MLKDNIINESMAFKHNHCDREATPFCHIVKIEELYSIRYFNKTILLQAGACLPRHELWREK